MTYTIYAIRLRDDCELRYIGFARVLSETRIANERERIRAKARQMLAEMGLPDDGRLA